MQQKRIPRLSSIRVPVLMNDVRVMGPRSLGCLDDAMVEKQEKDNTGSVRRQALQDVVLLQRAVALVQTQARNGQVITPFRESGSSASTGRDFTSSSSLYS